VANSNDEDVALSRRAARGDSAAFAMLVEKYERPLRSFLGRMGAGDAADDIAQEAFFKAWKRADQYDGRARYATWLTKIAWRCQIDNARRQRPVEAEPGVASVHSGVEVRDMLARLSDGERAALVLCEGHGWTHGEAADLLSLPLGTLKSMVARAKSKCRQMWNEEQHG
jgi:DNA-directed RNA polymerase specialized sigma24 family protein